MIKSCDECKKQCLDYHHILEIRLNDESETLMNYEINLLFNKCQKRIMENIEWDKLEKTKVERVVSTTFIEKILPEGVYKCPQCDGEGKVMTVHRFSPPHEYGTCKMCRETGEIRKCPVCNINPVPNIKYVLNNIHGVKEQEECIDCFEAKGKRLREEFMERVNKGVK